MLTKQQTSAVEHRPTLSTILPIATPNGFTLLEGHRVGGTTSHRFWVCGPAGTQQSISVRFDRSLIERVDHARGTHLWIGSRFWGLRAEAHLESYLVETANYPPNGQLVIDELPDDELLLAAYWQD